MSQPTISKSATLSFIESQVTVKVKMTRDSSTDSLTSLPDSLEYEPTPVSYSPLLLFTSFINHTKHAMKSSKAYEFLITYPVFIFICIWSLIGFLRSDPKKKKGANKLALAALGLSFTILIAQAVLMFALGIIGCMKAIISKAADRAVLLPLCVTIAALSGYVMF